MRFRIDFDSFFASSFFTQFSMSFWLTRNFNDEYSWIVDFVFVELNAKWKTNETNWFWAHSMQKMISEENHSSILQNDESEYSVEMALEYSSIDDQSPKLSTRKRFMSMMMMNLSIFSVVTTNYHHESCRRSIKLKMENQISKKGAKKCTWN